MTTWNVGPRPHPVTGKMYNPDWGWEPTSRQFRQASTYAGHAPCTEDPLDAIAEVVGRIAPRDDFEPDIEWEPDVAPPRPTIRSAYFPPEHDFEISRSV